MRSADPKKIRHRAATLALSIALLAGGARAVEPPRLIFQAPAELRGTAASLEQLPPEVLEPAMRRTGLAEAGPPILVVLAPESSPAARSAPAWVSGYANGTSGVVVLMPARTGRYPDRGLVPLLQHEVAHVLIARAAMGGEVPRWFDEGLAMAASREWGLGDRARVALAVIRDDTLPLARIDRAFHGGSAEVEAAYALARDIVRELLARHGPDAGARILARVARGERFKDAFAAATGVRLSTFERSYWEERTLWDRWVPILTSSALLWGGISLLAILAFQRRRARDLVIREGWEAEERARLELADTGSGRARTPGDEPQ